MEFDRVKFTGLRVTKGLSQLELAKELEVSRNPVNFTLSNSMRPPL